VCFGEGEWVIDVVNGDTANFLSVLNVQASRVSAKLVITPSAAPFPQRRQQHSFKSFSNIPS
jgi:hypothetical protein